LPTTFNSESEKELVEIFRNFAAFYKSI